MQEWEPSTAGSALCAPVLPGLPFGCAAKAPTDKFSQRCWKRGAQTSTAPEGASLIPHLKLGFTGH